MNKFLIHEGLHFYNKLPKNNIIINYSMPYHSGNKKMSKMAMNKLSDKEYYEEHSKHHSKKHIDAMKALVRMGIDRDKSHNFVKKYVGK